SARTLEGNVQPLALDVTDAASVARAKADAIKRFGRVDVLVNNAAVLLDANRELFDIPGDLFRTTMETNVLGAIATSAAFVPGMIERRFGRVVNVSSRAGQLATMGDYAPAYSISKAALNAFTLQLAAATNGSGVLVNSADPGWVRTEMGGSNATRSVQQGADTIVWLATLPDNGPTGEFFSDRRRIDW